MDYICPICGKSMAREIDVIMPHTDKHVTDEIKKTHPKWAESDGTCRKCYDWYKKQLHFK